MHRLLCRKSERQQGFTLIELLVVIAIIGTLAALFSGNIITALRKGDQTTCMNNLGNMGKLAQSYSFENRNNYPVAKGKPPAAYESLQKLVNFLRDEVKPSMFVCPSSGFFPAETDEDDRFVLDETSCTYAWLGRPMRNDAKGTVPLGSDIAWKNEDATEGNHIDFLQVVYADTSVSLVYNPDMEVVPDGAKTLPEGSGLPKGLVGNGDN